MTSVPWNETILEDFPPMAKVGYVVAATILTASAVAGVILNSLVILVMTLVKKLRSPLHFLLLNMIISDLCISIVASLSCTAAISGGWTFDESWCTFYGFFMQLNGLANIYTITALAYERYVMINPHSISYPANKRTVIYLMLIWVCAAVLSAPPLLAQGYLGRYAIDSGNISCALNWNDQSLGATIYITALVIFGVCVPTAVIAICFWKIRLIVKNSSRRLGRELKTGTSMTFLILIMFLTFEINWCPYAVVSLYTRITAGNVRPEIGVGVILLAKTCVWSNPVIYIMTFKELNFWDGVRRLCRRRRDDAVAIRMRRYNV